MSCKGLKGKALAYCKSKSQPHTVKIKTLKTSKNKKVKTKSNSEVLNNVTGKRTQKVSTKTNKKPKGKTNFLVTETKKNGERVVVAPDGTRNSFGHRKSKREIKKFQRNYKS